MNDSIIEFARTEIKNGLRQLEDDSQELFKKMYANGNMNLSIEEVVDRMDIEKLDWALTQVQNSLKKLQPGLCK